MKFVHIMGLQIKVWKRMVYDVAFHQLMNISGMLLNAAKLCVIKNTREISYCIMFFHLTP